MSTLSTAHLLLNLLNKLKKGLKFEAMLCILNSVIQELKY